MVKAGTPLDGCVRVVVVALLLMMGNGTGPAVKIASEVKAWMRIYCDSMLMV